MVKKDRDIKVFTKFGIKISAVQIITFLIIQMFIVIFMSSSSVYFKVFSNFAIQILACILLVEIIANGFIRTRLL
ncbi:hypothetical protein DY052_06120 [Apilactobacillus timberlakei]|nr:hypothetical protein DY052_06120 [Apilactobacillus timberlakei]